MRKRSTESVPFEVQASFVESLYTGGAAVLVGGAIQAAAVLGAWFATGQAMFCWLAAAMMLSGIWRYIEGVLFQKNKNEIRNLRDLTIWKNRYLAAGVFAASLIGIYAFMGIYAFRSEYATLSAAILAAGSSASIVGRNYGSAKLVSSMIIAISLPLVAALVMLGDIAHLILAALVFPFFLLVRSNAAAVRAHLFEATTRKIEASNIADRFDTALNNMPHGLLMFSDDGLVEVANRRAHQLLGISATERLESRNFRVLLRYFSSKRQIDRPDSLKLQSLVRNLERSKLERKVQVRTANGGYLEFSLKNRSGGGGVLIFEDVTERLTAEKKIQHMARYDSLTGLANRAEMSLVVGNMFQSPSPSEIAAVFMLDVNDFKHINDTYGHPAGDAILKQIASRIAGLESDTVRAARLGGDEFFIAVSGLKGFGGAQDFARALSDRLCGSYDCNGSSYQVSVSIGVVAPAAAQETLESLLMKADLALYAVKGSRGSRWKIYEESMSQSYRHKQRMKTALREAIQTCNLGIIYQPILSSFSMKLTSCEALSRWHHPEFGHVPPSEYIPLAEEMGLISEITRFMLYKACHDCTTWNRNMSVSVNLSTMDFQYADVVAMVAGALRDSGLQPHRLEVEVTESIVLGDKGNARDVLDEIKRMGVKIALDDFGTGYSNLSYLHDLPLDRIKIDRSFVRSVTESERALSLLRGVISLAREVGLFITLEGIETVEQLELIGAAANVDRYQGFLFGASYSPELVRDLAGTIWGTTQRSWSAESLHLRA